jgi:hypothetical protein
VLDAIGIFDPTGIADLGSAGISAYKGNTDEVVVSLVGALFPYIGDIAKVYKGWKFFKGGSEVAETATGQAIKHDEVLYRFGDEFEDARSLANQADRARVNGLPHGVSVSNRPSSKYPNSSAKRSEVEVFFDVIDTGRPGHRTVVLPKPVTDDVATLFNDLFGRKPPGMHR